MAKRLYRSRTDRMIWGVCGGLANYFDVDPTIIRIAAVLSIFVSGAGILAYIIMAIVVPLETSSATEPKQVIRENVEEIKTTATEFSQEIRSTFGKDTSQKPEMPRSFPRGLSVIAVILIIVGLIFLLSNLSVFWWLRWQYLWPAVIIAIGLMIILRPRRR